MPTFVFKMADVHSEKVRSYNMSRIKGKNTKPEMLVRRFLFSHGYRYRLHEKKLPGKPDIVLPKYNTAIFIHGCFWHGHNDCRYFIIPKTRTDWWLDKINRNKTLDNKSAELLEKNGWRVIVIWECDLRPAKVENRLSTLLTELKNG
jgi:DNA mismatch endonuclease, patch repair protein